MALEIFMASSPIAAKIKKERIGPASTYLAPKTRMLISLDEAAIIATKGKSHMMERIETMAISLAPESSSLLRRLLNVDSRGGDSDLEKSSGGMERFIAAP
jgi:hypothetical protein